jgi:hypothetical protein
MKIINEKQTIANETRILRETRIDEINDREEAGEIEEQPM